jgi:ATP-dependent DNA helicase RecQ
VTRIETSEGAPADELLSEQNIRRVLQKSFGFQELRPGQLDVMQDLLAGRQVISVMPTGAGKSLCYQLPATLLAEQQGLTLVVSPLIALMKDQVDSLLSRGVRTAALTSAATSAEQSEILAGIASNSYDIIYVAPERFRSQRFMSALDALPDKLALLAIDEAHCISEWGHDFRPAYRLLGQAVIRLEPVRVLAVTATATPEVRLDIAKQLGMHDPVLHVRGFARPSLCFAVEHAGGAKDKSARIVAKVKALNSGCALVYAATRKNSEKYAAVLADAGLRARAYHAGLEDQHRAAVQDEFMNGDIDVIVATNAFGMGVDKVDVRLVIHADLTRSIEAYYQEAGRGGRDGEHADCVLLFNHGDVRLQEFLIAASFPSAELLRALWNLMREQPGLLQDDLSSFNLPGEPHESTLSSAVRILGRHGYLLEESGRLHAVQPKEIAGEYPEFDAHSSERRADVETSKLKLMVEYSYHAGCRHEFVLDYFGEERPEERSQCAACDNCQGFGEAEALSESQLEQAETLLAIVGELDGRFGRKRIACIANGSDDDERFYGMAKRGALSGTSQKALLDLLRSLEAGSLVQQSGGEYPTIKLSRTGKKIVRGQAAIDPELLRLLPSGNGKSSAGKRRSKSVSKSALEGTADLEVADKLRTLRSDLAREHSVPAYVVFSNRTLDELATIKPKSRDELDGVHGIGPSRIDKYGDAIIALITAT